MPNLSTVRLVRALSIIIYLALFQIVVKADTTIPTFDTNILILQIPNKLLDPQLSSGGNFVVSRAGVIVQQEAGYIYTPSAIYLWNLENLKDDSEPTLLQPSIKRDVSLEDYPVFAISPDEKHLAVRTTASLTLFTLPALEFVKSTSAYGGTHTDKTIITWSEDSRLIATLLGVGAEIKVWDIVSDEEYTYKTNATLSDHEWQQPVIAPVTDGWIVKDFPDSSLAFMSCNRDLKQCDSYRFEDRLSVVVTSEGEIVLTEKQTGIGVWTRQSDGKYILNNTLMGEDQNICLGYFSPSGQYLYARCGKEGTIWDFSTLTPLYNLSDYRQPKWFPDENYFVTLRPNLLLQLHHLGEDKPIQSLNLSTVAGFNLRGLVESDLVNVEGISSDGRRILIGIGGAAIVVPIVDK